MQTAEAPAAQPAAAQPSLPAPPTPPTPPAPPTDGASPAIVINGTNGEPDIRIDVQDGKVIVAQGTTEKVIPIRDVVPKGAVAITAITFGCLAFMVVGWPIARAIARMIDRRTLHPSTTPALGREAMARLEALERNVDTVAIEVEKLSEAQRFTTRLLESRTPPTTP
jgi:hypothetical protein